MSVTEKIQAISLKLKHIHVCQGPIIARLYSECLFFPFKWSVSFCECLTEMFLKLQWRLVNETTDGSFTVRVFLVWWSCFHGEWDHWMKNCSVDPSFFNWRLPFKRLSSQFLDDTLDVSLTIKKYIIGNDNENTQ